MINAGVCVATCVSPVTAAMLLALNRKLMIRLNGIPKEDVCHHYAITLLNSLPPIAVPQKSDSEVNAGSVQLV
jgi:hypothetical protein